MTSKIELNKLISAVLADFCNYAENYTGHARAKSLFPIRAEFLLARHITKKVPPERTWQGIYSDLCLESQQTEQDAQRHNHSPEEFAAEFELVDGGKGGGLAP